MGIRLMMGICFRGGMCRYSGGSRGIGSGL